MPMCMHPPGGQRSRSILGLSSGAVYLIVVVCVWGGGSLTGVWDLMIRISLVSPRHLPISTSSVLGFKCPSPWLALYKGGGDQTQALRFCKPALYQLNNLPLYITLSLKPARDEGISRVLNEVLSSFVTLQRRSNLSFTDKKTRAQRRYTFCLLQATAGRLDSSSNLTYPSNKAMERTLQQEPCSLLPTRAPSHGSQ